jgi:hypothetical protein
VPDAIAAKLTRYVERGGNLVSEACPGRVSEHGYAMRGELSPAMAALFGVRQVGLSMVREPGDGMRWSPPERTWGEYVDAAMLAGAGPLEGHDLRANVYVETFECLDSQPLLMYGDAGAGAVREHGQGRAWLLGTFAGHGGTAYRDDASRGFVRALLDRCGVDGARAGELLLRKRAIAGKEAWLFTNPTDHEVVERIFTAGWAAVEDLLGEPLERDGDIVRLKVNSLDVRGLIVTRQA